VASEGLHEPIEALAPETIEMHRAIVSLMEELEAVDWYQQRADACADEQLKEVLLHNMNEELEHAVMVLEWMRRHNAKLDHYLRTLLFTEGEIAGAAHGEEGPPALARLRIGKLDPELAE
jgi:ferritin-like protein